MDNEIDLSTRDEEGLFSNLLFEEAVDEAQCEQMQMEVSATDSATSIDQVPNLQGKWVSQE
ncbi:hypothetical protein RUM44_004867 [Polyplax serrata]|uniref:Uncharacterized protein n=1 Tax=Polyplax serrata TaxID=468196 RepID=A0ABR1B409_POLSC